jgi:hypothetical protein
MAFNAAAFELHLVSEWRFTVILAAF